MKILYLILTLTLTSLSLYSQSPYRSPRQYGEYIPPSDLGLLERALRQKQESYDRNYRIVYQYIDYLNEVFTDKVEEYEAKDKTFSESQAKYVETLNKNLNTILTSDLSSNSYTTQAISYIKACINTINKW